MITVTHRVLRRAVVTCECGTLALNDHATAAEAWQFAADHVALTSRPTGPVCTPQMAWDEVMITEWTK